MDQDAQIAYLASKSDAHVDAILRALSASRGDTKAALKVLRRPASVSAWLETQPKKPRKQTEPILISSSDSEPDSRKPTGQPTLKSLNQVLKDTTPTSARPSSSKLPPLHLGTPALVARHTPCTLCLDVLPPELASELYLEMLHESQRWQRNEWYLFERLVESPHTTSFYIDGHLQELQEAGLFWYNGKQERNTDEFTPAMRRAKDMLEPLVQQCIEKRPRFDYEWKGSWRANVAAANCYKGQEESVGFHSDRLNGLGPYPTICSLSLGTTRTFRLRSVGEANNRTYDISLPHNSMLLMHAGCQESFKHAVPPQRTMDLFRLAPIPDNPPFELPRDPDGRVKPFNQRINITLRFYRPDFCVTKDSEYPPVPICSCGVPCILRPDAKHKQPADSPEGPYRYMWMCGAGAATEGKSCGHFEYLKMPRVR